MPSLRKLGDLRISETMNHNTNGMATGSAGEHARGSMEGVICGVCGSQKEPAEYVSLR